MNRSITTKAVLASLLLAATACSDEFRTPGQEGDGNTPITLGAEINQVTGTRVSDDGFADGDVIGVYIVDYEGTNPGVLKTEGNRGNNIRHTFDEANYRWTGAYDVYWKDNHTPIDVYGYYPVSTPEDVNKYAFTVQKDQNKAGTSTSMGGYEASDLLWGKVANVSPTDKVIRIPFTHRLSNACVTLIEGEGFTGGEWASLSKQVLVTNAVLEAEVNLADGSVKATGQPSTTPVIPVKTGDEWRAIVVPHDVKQGTQMFSITIDGLPYKFAKNEDFSYVAGKMSNFGIRVDKKEATGDYKLTLVSESITAWVTDNVSHDATARQYIVINVDEPGTLEECIIAAGKDPKKVKNLKLTGQITTKDFAVMKYKMESLAALNLKEVVIKAGEGSDRFDDYDNSNYHSCEDDEIPALAMNRKETLTSLVLPDRLRKISGHSGGNGGAFAECHSLSGSLVIPEGVEEIGYAAFADCIALTGTLSLPSTLKRIGRQKGYMGGWDGAFKHCNFTCQLVFPEGLEEIGLGSFNDCKNLYGELRLPDGLKYLGESAFAGCENLKGNLTIPQGVQTIPAECFNGTWLGGNLNLHDGIITIDERAFANTGLRGELRLPQNLEVINNEVFYNCDFSGELVLPKVLRTIGNKAFAYNWRLMGVLEIPENVISIGAGAFAQCRSLEGVIFPEALENIQYNTNWGDDGGAFQNCFGIGKIVCKGYIPAYVQSGVFDGVAKDNFTLEVPETAVAQYQAAPGWCEFKRIAAHHELVCRPSVASALGSEHKQTLVINSEGEWEVASKPDWCELSQNSGNKKTEVTLTIKKFDNTEGMREGDVVFRLKGKDYTHQCHVRQHGYQYAEDEYLTLQTATKGKNGGINLVFLGDGYDSNDISAGNYLKDIKEGVEHFFGIEPYTAYRDYFNVYTAFPLSTETGVGTVNTIRYNRFNTTYTGGVGLRCDYDEVFAYAMKAPTVNESNIDRTLIVIIPNSTDYGGICQMWESGAAIAFCPKSDYGYPLDSRGVMQHEAGGHGFGKLGDEYIYHNAFIDFCSCTCCGHDFELRSAKALGWYDNLELNGKMHQVGWSHLIFDPRYSGVVDIFEGGYMHTRGVFRSEQNSCMNNDIPYYSTISRESIVKRIKRYAGEEFDFEDFVANDRMEAGATTRSLDSGIGRAVPSRNMAPVFHKGSPVNKNGRVSNHRN